MNSRIRLGNKFYRGRISVRNLADIAFVLYFINPFLRVGFGWILSFLGLESAAWTFALVLVYLPFALLLVYSPRKSLPLDCIILYGFILCFFLLTYLIHPEYEYWYSRPEYGAWAYVFRPNQAIYAYLFVRLMDSQERLLKNMRISGWIMYVYFLYQVFLATRRGYWAGVSTTGNVEISYSVSLGYDVLLYTLPLLYCAVRERKISDIVGSLFGIFLILSYGSRGPLLFLGIFVILSCMMYLQKSRKKVLVITAVAFVAGVVYLFYVPMLTFLAQVLESVGISSRFITMILEGTIADENGRNGIWMAAIEMIKKNPWGYGFMGSQHEIGKLILVGYPHSFILEILIDFGVFVGTAILIFIFYNSYAMLFKKKNSDWSGAYLIFVATACQLFISLCYWSATAFWVCLAIIVNSHTNNQRKNGIRKLHRIV